MNPAMQVPKILTDAIHRVFTDHSRDVGTFGLRVAWDGIRNEYDLWAVPVASGLSTQNAHEFIRVLRLIEHEIEQHSQLPVSVVYLPGTTTANGNSRS